MESSNGKMEQMLEKILDYQTQHKLDQDGILIMLSLLNLMGMVNVLNQNEDSDSDQGTGNIGALIGPLMALMASGMGKGGSGSQAPFNPAALLSMLGGGTGKGSPDISGLMGLLGPLLGAMGQGQQAPNPNTPSASNKPEFKPQPIQREVNLDSKNKTDLKKQNHTNGEVSREKAEQLPKSDEVLKWDFGT